MKFYPINKKNLDLPERNHLCVLLIIILRIAIHKNWTLHLSENIWIIQITLNHPIFSKLTTKKIIEILLETKVECVLNSN